MTDKEIMIDGVDVSGCGYYDEIEQECNICGMGKDREDTFCRKCKDNKNCYYKQLKRLEAENAKLKEYLKMYQFSDEQHLLKVILIEQILTKIKEIAEDIITNDVYENSDVKAKRIIDLINESEV